MQLAPLAPWVHLLYVTFPTHVHTYTCIHSHTTCPPPHTHSYTSICDWNTDMHFCRIAQCTLVKNIPCTWQLICKASSNTLCTLFVQNNGSTCNYETPQRCVDCVGTLLYKPIAVHSKRLCSVKSLLRRKRQEKKDQQPSLNPGPTLLRGASTASLVPAANPLSPITLCTVWTVILWREVIYSVTPAHTELPEQQYMQPWNTSKEVRAIWQLC